MKNIEAQLMSFSYINVETKGKYNKNMKKEFRFEKMCKSS